MQTIQEQDTEALKELALSRLTKKQKVILRKVGEMEGSQISFFVASLKQELECSDSILWKSIKSLRQARLLSDSKRISLTCTGKFLIKQQ